MSVWKARMQTRVCRLVLAGRRQSGALHWSDRSGIALITVLGMLAMMVLLAVAFSVSMRVERLATRNYLDVVKGRQLMGAALARSVDSIDRSISTNFSLYPLWNVFGSTGGDTACGDLLDGVAVDYIPDSMVGEATTVAGTVRWTNIVYGGKVVGRFAFLAVDCSGLLDANYVGGSPRGRGVAPAEIDFSELPERVTAGGSVDAFAGRRSAEWKRFESLPELAELAASYFQPYPANVFVYSRFPEESFLPDIFSARTNIAWDADGLRARRSEIIDGFTECGITNAQEVFYNLLDYVDEDSVPNGGPQGVDSFCTEAVPMINEIVVANKITMLEPSNSVFRHDVDIVVETWYPFPNRCPSVKLVLPNPGSDVTFEQCVPAEIHPDPAGTGPSVPSISFHHDEPYSFRTNAFRYSVTATNVVFPGGNMLLRTRVSGVQVKLDRENDDIVDRVSEQTPPLIIMIMGRNIQALPRNGSVEGSIGVSCVDPRLNWRSTDWTPQAISLGGVNANAVDVNEGISPMYARNARLVSVAELGFLSIGEPWRTIALYTSPHTPSVPELHPVLSRFRIGPVPTNSVKGLVNANSQNTNALAAAFFGSPIESYPGDPANSNVTWDLALALAGDIVATNVQPFNKIAEVGKGLFNYDGFVGLPDAQRESIIRNTYELLGLRQNLFTILIAVQAVDGVNAGGTPQEENIRSEQRAVAVVWRDPIPDGPPPNGRYPTFVRFFHWLVE